MSVDHSKNLIEVKNVSFVYGNEPALKNINFSIHQGDYLGVIGPNGGGKTTLLKIMLGLLRPTSGEVRLFGHSTEEFSEWWKMGYVAQIVTHFDPLFPVTVREVVSMGRYGKKGIGRSMTKADEQMIDSVLEEVGMKGLQYKLIGDLSGGQQQRAFIGRALAGEPAVLFLDEPTTGIDVDAQEQFYILLDRLNKEKGITLVLVSHDVDVVTHEATEVACINQSLVYHGEPKEFVKGDYLEKLYSKGIRHILHDH
jgi:zinc transport system ATP-binding protein